MGPGRPQGQKNKKGHKAGRPRARFVLSKGQSHLPFAEASSSRAPVSGTKRFIYQSPSYYPVLIQYSLKIMNPMMSILTAVTKLKSDYPQMLPIEAAFSWQ